MILSSIRELSSLLMQKMPQIVLISGQDDFGLEEGYEEIKRVCKGLTAVKVEEASKLDELLGAPSLFGEKRLICIEEVDSLKEKELKPLLRFLARPDPQIVLVLTAESIKPQSELYKLIEAEGVIVLLPKVSPWDKEAKMQAWVIEYLKATSVKIAPNTALKLAQGISGGYNHFIQELEKLKSYVGEKKEIRDADLVAISQLDSQSTLWQLSDALLESKGELFQALTSLQTQDVHSFVLIRHLRNALQQALQIASFVQCGYPDAKIHEKFPNLKGKHFEKIRARSCRLGTIRLGKAVIILDQLQASLKDGPADDTTLIQTGMVRLKHALHSS